MDETNLKYEKEKLAKTKLILKEVKSGEETRLKNLPKMYASNPRLLASLMTTTSTKISNIDKVQSKPYFSRIDFKESGKSLDKLYIGKIGVLDLDGKIVVTDWRAPISSLYYDANLGNVVYDSPSGSIEGELSLKRQIITENGEIVNIFDVDTVSDDELLKPYLGANADSRLKNIVASIQSEQNMIIRKKISKDLIVQGVAGSGKTTVALHRIAYLIYNNVKQFNASQFMVIGPNKFFINYISSVLPDLDAKNAVQYTYEELAKDFIKERFCVEDSTQKLTEILLKKCNSTSIKFKTSMKYYEILKEYFFDFEKEYIKEFEFKTDGFVVVSNEVIQEVFNTTLGDNINDRLKMTANMLASKISKDNKILLEVKEYYSNLYDKEIDVNLKNKIFQKQIDVVRNIQKGYLKELKKLLTIDKLKIFDIYNKFVNNVDKYSNLEIIKEVKEETLNNFKRKMFNFEDIPALMYIKYKLSGMEEFKEYVHVVIDEAQDFGNFHFYMLKKIMKNATFSIFGDVAQGIYSYRSISDWKEIKSNVLPDVEILSLEKSYRTSMEIMKEANKISKKLNLDEGKPVIRTSGPVKKVKVSIEERSSYLKDRIEEFNKRGYKSIAIICKEQSKIDKLYKELKEKNVDAKLIYRDQETYDGGICLLTSYLAKGLEFDAVIITDSDESVYSSENDLDLKLLYVAMTRALHTLELMYVNNINECLK